MSSIPPIQCLFCKHLNPAGAIFCNECGTQLNVQPCDHCGAIDAREAKTCHKCGAEFPLHSTLEPHPVSGPLANDQDVALNSPALMAPPPAPLDLDLAKSSTKVEAAAARSRRNWLPAAAGLSLALIAGMTFVYFDRVQPQRLAQKPGVTQAVSVASAKPTSAQTTQAAQTEVALTPTVQSLPTTDRHSNTRPNSLASNECPQAVATLGLCNPDTAEKRQ